MTQFPNHGSTALTWANIDIVKILAPLSCTPNSFVNKNETNWTPIYYATICQSKEIVKFLSSLTKSPNAADINEWTPIHAASAFGFLDIVELLVYYLLFVFSLLEHHENPGSG